MDGIDRNQAHRLEMGDAWRGYNYALAYQDLHPEVEVGIAEIAGAVVKYCGAGSPLNRAVGLGLQGPVLPEQMEEIEAFYHSRGEPARLDVCPLVDESLLALVQQRAYRLERFYNILYQPLAAGWQPQPPAPGVAVRLAQPAEAQEWLLLSAQGFEGRDDPDPAIFDVLGPNFHSRNAACFFAYVEGQPAGTGGMYYNHGVVELGGASTRPQFRRRGVQTALVHARLAEAARLGCDLAMVLTSPGSDSQHNLQRMGFQLAYTKVTMILT